jgi:DMSO/TMAO reductase YedYZ molybdopterin-dependent catalytic subunit
MAGIGQWPRIKSPRLPALDYGAPLRLVIPVKSGLKSIKRIGTMTFTDERPPGFRVERGYGYYLGH